MKILLADDHALFRDGLRMVIEALEENLIVIEAGSFPEALDIVAANDDLDLALVDLNMPGMNPLDGVKALTAKLGERPLVVLSAMDDRENILAALNNGASGYIPKTMERKVVFAALKLVLSGGVYLPPHVLGILDGEPAGDGEDPALELTARQTTILQAIHDGKSNKAIARNLGIAESTVKFHVTGLLKKLGVSNRTQAAVKAVEMNLVKPENDG